MRAITGKKDNGKKAASSNTIGRFETDILTQRENLTSLSAINGKWVQKAMSKTKHRRIILDMDSSESPVHGEQEGSAYNGCSMSTIISRQRQLFFPDNMLVHLCRQRVT